MKIVITISVWFSFLFLSCSKKISNTENATRSFYMGTTPWPAALTISEVEKTYQFINNNCDIVAHHFDEGIPFEEAFTNTAMPSKLVENVNFRKTKTASEKKVFLSVAALSIFRNTKAPYYTQATTASNIKNNWEQLPFNDAKIITAYVNYISWLINQFNPIYVNYGVESNSQNWDAQEFLKYKFFLQQVYTQLKLMYPTIPFFISYIVDESNAGYQFATQLINYTDFIGLSAYPYISISSSSNGNTNPQNFPINYFEKFINIQIDKPLAFAETGYIAQNMLIPAYNLNKEANTNWQDNYLQIVLNLCKTKNAKLLIWFCPKDYDEMVTATINQGTATQETINLLSLWKDIGLIDENGNARPAYNTWINWYNKKKQ